MLSVILRQYQSTCQLHVLMHEHFTVKMSVTIDRSPFFENSAVLTSRFYRARHDPAIDPIHSVTY